MGVEGEGGAQGECEFAGDGEAEAVAFSAGLGGDEGGEEVALEGIGDAGALVENRDDER